MKKNIIKLKFIEGVKDPVSFDVLELPNKTAALLLKQHSNNPRPKYIAENDLRRWGFELEEDNNVPPVEDNDPSGTNSGSLQSKTEPDGISAESDKVQGLDSNNENLPPVIKTVEDLENQNK